MGGEDRLHYAREGAGEPLVLLHPLGAELVVWEPVIPLLAGERDVIALDLPGFGRSPSLPLGASPTPQALAQAVARFLDTLGIERAHVAGNSLGGWIALELARAGRTLSVSALSPAGFWARPLGARLGPDLRARGSPVLPLLSLLARTRIGRRRLLRASVGHPERVPAAAAARLVRSYVTAPAYAAANAEMRGAVLSGLDEIAVPVTLAWGELDRLVRPPRSVPAGWRTTLLRGCGHIPTWDDPDQVSALLLEASGVALPGSLSGTSREAGG
jgi:pimeloyl-ACP methyl ester carboxylesterase